MAATLRIAALVLLIANEFWVGSMIWERIYSYGFQCGKVGCGIGGIIQNGNFWLSFPWLLVSLVLAHFAWTPLPNRLVQLGLAAVAVSEASFVWAFYALLVSSTL
jgi:hypothetical protein